MLGTTAAEHLFINLCFTRKNSNDQLSKIGSRFVLFLEFRIHSHLILLLNSTAINRHGANGPGK